jgi:hypothetical protein
MALTTRCVHEKKRIRRVVKDKELGVNGFEDEMRSREENESGGRQRARGG